VSYLVVQISDFHIVEIGRLLVDAVDTAAFLRAAVDHLNALEPAPDVVLATGDLANDGRGAQYEHLRQLLAPLRAPLRLVPGNHDERAALRAVFPDHEELGTDGYVQYVVDGPARVVVLDSSRFPEPGGRLDAGQLEWLDGALGRAPTTPTIVAVHHPPFATGIGHMDAMGLHPADADALAAIIARHPQVERIQCGHLHRSITTRWHGTIAATAPGVAHAVALDLVGGPGAWNREPPACTLHWWTPATGLVSHVQAIGAYPATRYERA
jgi:3',5'-cyclic AMP phosphodiesterase CpdA